MEWVLTTGFLEQVFRNEQVRRPPRHQEPGPGVGPLIRARRGVSADGLHRPTPPKARVAALVLYIYMPPPRPQAVPPRNFTARRPPHGAGLTARPTSSRATPTSFSCRAYSHHCSF
jgi:hypothetical protein